MEVSPHSSSIQLSELVPNVRIAVISLAVFWFLCSQGCSRVTFAKIIDEQNPPQFCDAIIFVLCKSICNLDV